MRVAFLLCLCASVLLGCAAVSPEDELSGFVLAKPVELTDADFDASIADGKIWTVMFYAPWCGHCKKAMPMWDKLAKSAEIKTAGVRIARIDGSAGGKSSMQKWAVEHAGMSSFPSILRFQHGKVWSYTGERKLGPIESWSVTPGNSLDDPTLFSKVYQKCLGYALQASRWVSGRSTVIVGCCMLFVLVALVCFGFMLGYYWREWRTDCMVHVRWGTEGRFVPFAMIPVDTNVKLIRKNTLGEEIPLKSFGVGDGSEVFCRMEDAQQFWVPGMQQLDPKAMPPPPPPVVIGADGEAKEKPE